MKNHPHLHHQLQQYLSQYSHYCDKRHLITLSWMVVGLVLSQSLCPSEWEPYVISRAQQAASYQKRWSRFWNNPKINPEKLYLPLVMAAISNLSQQRIYLALDTSMLWNQYCMIHVSVILGGRAIPLIWNIVLLVYQRTYHDDFPIVCLDECLKQLVKENREPIPAQPGQAEKFGYQYERNGTANLFMLINPIEGWRAVEVTERRTALSINYNN